MTLAVPLPLPPALDEKIATKDYIERIMDERDRLYDTRFRAADIAVAAALAAQEKATSTALAAQEKATAAAFSASEKAIDKAESASERRFESVNEFRAQLGDQQRTFMPRAEVELLIGTINVRMTGIEKVLTDLAGQKRGIAEGWGWAIAVVAVVLAIASRFIP